MALHDYTRKLVFHGYHFGKIKNDPNFVLDEQTNIDVDILEEYCGSNDSKEQKIIVLHV